MAETGLLLATEPSLLMYFSCDTVKFQIDNEWDEAEPPTPFIDKYCGDSCRVVVPQKTEPTGDDLESVRTTEPDELTKKK